jgi:hypothetical protein
MPNVDMFNVIIPSVIMLNVIMPNFVMLNVIMLNVIMLNVVAPTKSGLIQFEGKSVRTVCHLSE